MFGHQFALTLFPICLWMAFIASPMVTPCALFTTDFFAWPSGKNSSTLWTFGFVSGFSRIDASSILLPMGFELTFLFRRDDVNMYSNARLPADVDRQQRALILGDTARRAPTNRSFAYPETPQMASGWPLRERRRQQAANGPRPID